MNGLVKFQKDRKLDEQTYDVSNESSNIFEELLESHGLDVPKENRPALKSELNSFINGLVNLGIANKLDTPFGEYEQVDAYCDIITFAIGAIMKLHHVPDKAIKECGLEINSRVGSMVDGKFEKDLSDEAKANWYNADYSKSKKVSLYKNR